MADETETDELNLDHGDNRPSDMILDEKLLKMGEEYVHIQERRRDLNDDAKTIRSNAEKLGIHPLAFQHAVNTVKLMDKADLKSYQSSVRRMVKVLEPAAPTLFPDETLRREKRKAKELAKAAKVADPRDKTAPDNPKGDPKRGGAGGAKGRGKAKDAKPKKPGNVLSGREEPALTAMLDKIEATPTEESGDELIARVAREKQSEQEQRDGGQILDTAMDGIKSQSQLAQEKREAALGDDA